MTQQICPTSSNLTASQEASLRSVIAIGSAIFALVLLFTTAGSAAAQVSQSSKAATAPPSAQTNSVSADAPGDPVRGRQLFVKNMCYSCHGYNGQGGSYTGPRIAPDPLPWQAVAAFIRNPAGLTPPYITWPFGVMPPFTSKNVPDKDVQDIVAYLKTVPDPTDLKSIPTYKK
jgi:mono/diheme cytochrome c family protein